MTRSNPDPTQDIKAPQGSALRDLFESGRLALRLFSDRRVPTLLKAIPFLALVYLISPLDFLPDSIPFVTQIDDLAVILIALKLFISMAPEDVVAELGGDATPGETIEADYRVHEG